MGTRGWVRYEPKYYNDTPEILRYVGLIRLVNGQLPNQRPRPKPPIRRKYLLNIANPAFC